MNPNITPQEPIQELESPSRDIEQKSQPEPSLAAASTAGSKDSNNKHKKEKKPKRLHRKHKIALAILTTLISIAVVSVAVVGFWFLMTITALGHFVQGDAFWKSYLTDCNFATRHI